MTAINEDVIATMSEEEPIPNADLAICHDKTVFLRNNDLQIRITDDRESIRAFRLNNFMCFCAGVSVGCCIFSMSMLFLPH